MGETAAVKRESTVVQERAKIVEAPPIRIEPQVVAVQKSERIEKNVKLLCSTIFRNQFATFVFARRTTGQSETVSVETLEFTSRLIEKKLSDFGVEVKVIAAYLVQ